MNRWIATILLPATTLLPSVATATDRVGLSLRLENGSSSEVEIVGNAKRFVDELDIVAVATTNTDEGIDPIIESGDLSGLDWSGVELSDEEWRPDGSGTFTRQRFYRGAAWMEAPSLVFVFQLDDDGHYLPELPLIVFAGSDDFWSLLDGGFIRRFSARQVTTGCAAVGDCSTATTFVAQGLAQLRHAQFPAIGAHKINKKTESLQVLWTADPLNLREVPIDFVKQQDADFAYGFDVDFDVATPPANGQYYVPGESITFHLSFTDGAGNDLAEAGMLPTYADFVDGGTDGGLRYFDVFLNPTLYYALKHREANLLLAMGGPTDALQVTDNTVPLADFFLPQTQSAFADEQGFTGVVTSVPSFAVIFGGLLIDPNIWNAPVADEVVLTVPSDAMPGTYVVTLKARRDWAGEARNTGAVHRIQVGTTTETEWEPTTQGCQSCHSGEAALSKVLHGIGDRESCLSGCHVSLENEPDNALDYRVHFVHTRSDRYPADPDDCTVCHVDEPEGIPRGYPGFVFPFD
jgi:hypothetical protein